MYDRKDLEARKGSTVSGTHFNSRGRGAGQQMQARCDVRSKFGGTLECCSREGWRGQRYHWPLKGGLVEPGRQCSGAMVVTEREL